jgi:ubiquinone/menaquinone biosynthesis C-methylase UbiE
MRTSVREVFAAAAGAYQRGNPLLAVERPETLALLPVLAGRDVLDLGAGRGHYAAFARSAGARLSVGLDLTFEMLELADRPVVVADAVRLPLATGTMDVAVAALVLSYLDDPQGALREAARVLRPEGVLVISDLHPVASHLRWRRVFQAEGGRSVEAEAAPYTVDRLRTWLEASGFLVEECREPVVDERLVPHFQAAGRRDFAALRGAPLLVVLRARKGAVGSR